MSVASSRAKITDLVRRGGWGPIEAVIQSYLAYKVPQWLLVDITPYLLPLIPFSKNVQSFVMYGLFELLVLLAIYGVARLYGVRFSELGLRNWKSDHLLLVAGGFFAYFALSIIVRALVSSFMEVPDTNQEIGFVNPTNGEMVLVFLMLVCVVPFAEEVLFRGFLFKGIRSRFSFLITALTVSVLFAVAHGQLSVGIDVFALSLVLCYLREKTDSLWPGILLHGLKNAVAFLLLFVYNVG
ncbi:MAG TPA: type II CAAX endopeptidase family protein [Candidatus Saccharimonadales bacterium]|nr:type II CAAX endopeptidase family protein [Candidatus Saccharimonadales bacterium]